MRGGRGEFGIRKIATPPLPLMVERLSGGTVLYTHMCICIKCKEEEVISDSLRGAGDKLQLQPHTHNTSLFSYIG